MATAADAKEYFSAVYGKWRGFLLGEIPLAVAIIIHLFHNRNGKALAVPFGLWVALGMLGLVVAQTGAWLDMRRAKEAVSDQLVETRAALADRDERRGLRDSLSRSVVIGEHLLTELAWPAGYFSPSGLGGKPPSWPAEQTNWEVSVRGKLAAEEYSYDMRFNYPTEGPDIPFPKDRKDFLRFSAEQITAYERVARQVRILRTIIEELKAGG